SVESRFSMAENVEPKIANRKSKMFPSLLLAATQTTSHYCGSLLSKSPTPHGLSLGIPDWCRLRPGADHRPAGVDRARAAGDEIRCQPVARARVWRPRFGPR